ncbi:Methionine import system permease protein MetP [Granulicatella adiacens]|jgi:methionine ABC superfamily ATP binding cassette transporter, permease protein|uniref:ABC transporter, permease protein n=1 Tax=Granulicatella adiacens ATCC 49175 TaxID=638301 RepID=C8NDR0_9LACT|nr:MULTISPECIES: methionine ABC transporter permease [Granulicatella]EEW38191.1 ABC transporter, permease protein [Granulicatella adiacens ATCC 49175]OFS99076.1 methionine ABC transporter permease [Granulicatella sp. HMSC31F03]RKW26876.1 MAG: ABC transporter permease [Granulicatella sp.]VTX81728.1 Methionine import system permease protein MetP [Granulicatella adiacens]
MFNVFLAQTSIEELFQQMFSFENVNWNEVIKATNETLYMTFIPTFYVFVIGLLLGILLFLTGKGRSLQNKFVHFILGGIINVFRSIPFIILLTLLMPFTKAIMTTIIGPKGAIPTLVISAAPFYARLVDIALNEIPSGVIEAAESMGANTRQIITKVLIPESLPALVSGITVTAIALVGSTAVAGAIGAGGLGNLAYMIGFTRNKQDIIFVATVAILVLVFIIQIIGDLTVKAIDKR